MVAGGTRGGRLGSGNQSMVLRSGLRTALERWWSPRRALELLVTAFGLLVVCIATRSQTAEAAGAVSPVSPAAHAAKVTAPPRARNVDPPAPRQAEVAAPVQRGLARVETPLAVRSQGAGGGGSVTPPGQPSSDGGPLAGGRGGGPATGRHPPPVSPPVSRPSQTPPVVVPPVVAPPVVAPPAVAAAASPAAAGPPARSPAAGPFDEAAAGLARSDAPASAHPPAGTVVLGVKAAAPQSPVSGSQIPQRLLAPRPRTGAAEAAEGGLSGRLSQTGDPGLAVDGTAPPGGGGGLPRDPLPAPAGGGPPAAAGAAAPPSFHASRPHWAAVLLSEQAPELVLPALSAHLLADVRGRADVSPIERPG
jgi:hypothetical protein